MLSSAKQTWRMCITCLTYMLLGKLESQEWVVRLMDGGMELWDQHGDLFAIVSKVNKLIVVAPGSDLQCG